MRSNPKTMRLARHIKDALRQPEKQIKLLCWLLFFTGIAGLWLYQRIFLLNIYADYAVSTLTLICMLIVLCLLPFSISRKLALPISWYAMIFCPSILILSFVANEHWQIRSIGISILLLALFLFIIFRRPKLKCKPANSNLWIVIILFIFAFTITDTNELTHQRYKIKRLISEQKYEEALNIGAHSLHSDSSIFNLRAEALVLTNNMGDKLFTYPVPSDINGITVTQALSGQQAGDIILCNLLIAKNLSEFALRLPKFHNISPDSLPRHYKEALIIYMSRTAHPILTYSDPLVEANYHEFLDKKKQYADPVIANSQCHSLYGNTYFWYYYFHNITNGARND